MENLNLINTECFIEERCYKRDDNKFPLLILTYIWFKSEKSVYGRNSLLVLKFDNENQKNNTETLWSDLFEPILFSKQNFKKLVDKQEKRYKTILDEFKDEDDNNER